MLPRTRFPQFIAAVALAALGAAACSGSAPRNAGGGARAIDPRVTRALASLHPSVTVAGEPLPHFTLAERMAHYHVPGVSIALVDSGRVVWESGFGVKEAGGADSVTAATIFQAASISKPVASLGTMTLVRQGKLGLDADVNGALRSWKVPENAFTTREKVTLRRIMSHSAGLTVHGFGGYAAGEPLPTVPQILDGMKPANSPPVRVDTVPGTLFRYSGGGMTVMQLLVTDVTGEAYPAFLRRTVLAPLGMTHSSYEQPLPATLASTAAVAHDRSGTPIAGKWHSYPEIAAAGLWTTAGDLARMIVAVQSAFTGRPSPLDRESIRQMLTPTPPTPYGIGFGLEGTGDTLQFTHGGSNAGYRCTFRGFATQGRGIAVMTNSDNGGALIDEIVAAMAGELAWAGTYGKDVAAVPLAATQRGRLTGTYRSVGDDATVVVSRAGDSLFIEINGFLPRQRAVATSDSTLVGVESGASLVFTLDHRGSAPAREVALPGSPLHATRAK